MRTAIIALLLTAVAWWASTRATEDLILHTPAFRVSLTSFGGITVFYSGESRKSFSIDIWGQRTRFPAIISDPQQGIRFTENSVTVVIAYWVYAIYWVVKLRIAWIDTKWRYRVGELLIFTTVIAVALALEQQTDSVITALALVLLTLTSLVLDAFKTLRFIHRNLTIPRPIADS